MILALLGANVPKDGPAAVKKLNSLVDKDGKTFGWVLLELFSISPQKGVVDFIEVSTNHDYAKIIFLDTEPIIFRSNKTYNKFGTIRFLSGDVIDEVFTFVKFSVLK